MKIVLHKGRPYRTIEDLIDVLDTGEFSKFENYNGKYLECWNQITGDVELEHYEYLVIPDSWLTPKSENCDTCGIKKVDEIWSC